MLSIRMIRRVLHLGCLMSVVVCALSIYTIRKVSTHLLYNEHIYSLPLRSPGGVAARASARSGVFCNVRTPRYVRRRPLCTFCRQKRKAHRHNLEISTVFMT